jgi:hypothetical protein
MVGEGMEIPVPTRFVRHCAKALEAKGLGASCDGLYFDFTGGVHARGVRVTGMNGMDILRVGQLYTHISPENALGGVPEFDVLTIDDATVVLPAYISDSGAESPVASHIYTKLDISRRKIHVEYLQAQVGGLVVSVANPFDVDPSLFRASPTNAAPDERVLAARIAAKLARLGRMEAYLDHVEAPSLSIAPAADLSSADARLLAKSVDWNGVSARGVDIEVAADKNFNLTLARAKMSDVEAFGAKLAGVRVLPECPLKIPANLDEAGKISGKARVYAAEVTYAGETVRGIDVRAERRPGATSFRTAFPYDGLPVSLAATVSDDRVATVDFELSARLGTVIRLGKLPEDKILKRFNTPEPFLILGRATVPKDANAFALDFQLWGWQMDARGMPVDNAYVRGHLTRDLLFCDDVHVDSRGSRVTGTFLQNIRTLDWRMCLKGSIYPPEIGPVLGKWWAPIWEDFTFDGPRVDADLDISGNWHERRYAYIVGIVDMEHIAYNGVRVKKGTLDLRTGKGFVDIYNIVAISDAGTMKGDIAWIIRPDETMDVTFAFTSNLPALDLDKAFGSVMTEQLPDWNFAHPPIARIRGNLEKLAPHKWTNDIYADVHVDGGEWRGIHFDSLVASVWNDKTRTIINIPGASLLGGTLSGVVAYDRSGEDKTIAFNLALNETDFTPTLRALQSLGPKKEEIAQIRQGKVRLHYQGIAKTKDIAGSIEGHGSFMIHDADLAKIKVFGALSKLMDSIGRGYGTFTLDAVSGDFTTSKGYVHLKRTTLTGPAAKVDAKGRIGMTDKSLDFEAKVFLLSTDKVSLMNVFGTILTPFGYIMELNLRGTFDDPSWRFKIDPRNIFDGGKPAPGAKPEASAPPAASGVKKGK